jgi:hypothetical protein
MRPRILRGFAIGIVIAAMVLCSSGCARTISASHAGVEGVGMVQTHQVQNISVTIVRGAPEVYEFARNGSNLPHWASGLGSAVHPEGDAWIAEGPLGRVRVRFEPHNDLGVLDHDVTLPSGEVVRNPMRVLPNGAGCTVIFTLMRPPGVSEEKFHDDAQWVQRDLNRLKALLEMTR